MARNELADRQSGGSLDTRRPGNGAGLYLRVGEAASKSFVLLADVQEEL